MDDTDIPDEHEATAHEWTGNAAVISNVVRFLPTGQDVLRCELVSSAWRSSTMCPVLPPMHLTTQALNNTCPPCLGRNAHRLASLRAAFMTSASYGFMRHSEEIDASNSAALEVLAASASNLACLVLVDIGYDLQDSVWGRFTSLTRLELNNSDDPKTSFTGGKDRTFDSPALRAGLLAGVNYYGGTNLAELGAGGLPTEVFIAALAQAMKDIRRFLTGDT
ncbi:hypothetical protein COO60DRAFT_1641933 [Scenedesmus sp. NREL 46B-D3]|nr:hypothetical protein COO60DRAFT_1641933 [Scenedesmus sp. NREL 46B-D3]